VGARWEDAGGLERRGSTPTINVRDIPLPGPSQEQASPPSLPAHPVRSGGPGEAETAGPYGPPETRGGAADIRSVPAPGRSVTLRRTAAPAITYGRRRPAPGVLGLLEQQGLVARVRPDRSHPQEETR
jgi:hypothetical protein